MLSYIFTPHGKMKQNGLPWQVILSINPTQYLQYVYIRVIISMGGDNLKPKELIKLLKGGYTQWKNAFILLYFIKKKSVAIL